MWPLMQKNTMMDQSIKPKIDTRWRDDHFNIIHIIAVYLFFPGLALFVYQLLIGQ